MLDGLEILDKEKQIAKANFLATIPVQELSEANKNALAEASLFFKTNYNNVNVEANEDDKIPTESQFVTANFRALSQTLLQNRGLDFSRPGVLEKGVALLMGKPVFPNHNFRDILNTLGVVSKTWWDSKGENSEGVPGINCEIKIDALMNLRIARGLTMNPPSINRMSLTVLFEFDYSHPRLVEERKFWQMIGEEVDGEIVRLIVTKIINIWEASLVFLGEDGLAKGLPKENKESELEIENLSAKDDEPSANNSKEKSKTMKLTEEQKALLGISHEGDDVPEQTILDAALKRAEETKDIDVKGIADLSQKATEGEKLLDTKRDEVKSLAKLVEFGGDEGELNDVVVKMIDSASAEDLISLEENYRQKIKLKFPEGGKSSLTKTEEVEDAGGVNEEERDESVEPTTLL